MSYKKPQIVAKSAAKQSYVAGCPAKTACSPWKIVHGVKISHACSKCQISGR